LIFDLTLRRARILKFYLTFFEKVELLELSQKTLEVALKKQKITESWEYLKVTGDSEFPNCISIEKKSLIEWLIVSFKKFLEKLKERKQTKVTQFDNHAQVNVNSKSF
jgi:hypothetical protein